MSAIIITLEYFDRQAQRCAMDLELPGQIAIGKLLPELGHALGLVSDMWDLDYIPYRLSIAGEDGKALPESISLEESDVEHGVRLALTSASFLTTSMVGDRYILSEQKTRLGRMIATTTEPAVDLSGEIGSETVHRSHAFIMHDNAHWQIKADDQVSVDKFNLTKVGEHEMRPGEVFPLQSGDQIQLGKVKLFFISA